MRPSRTLATTAIAAAAVLGLAPSASALTISPNFPNTPMETRPMNAAISPFGPQETCTMYRNTVGECWQQRPDGQWVQLQHVGFVDVYPVWEDPASLSHLIPGSLLPR